MTRHVLFTMILMIMTGVSYYLYDTGQNGDVHRSIQIKGVFVLVDELDLHNRLSQLSLNNPDRRKFLDEVRTMLKNEPYLESSTIRYSWPDEVVLEISEVSPVAMINRDRLLLKDCRIVGLESEVLSAPLIDFAVSQEQLGDDICKQILEVLGPIHKTGARHVSILGNGDYVLDFGRTKLVIGKDQFHEVPGKIGKLSMLIRMNRLHAEYVDLRYISGAAIRRVVKI